MHHKTSIALSPSLPSELTDPLKALGSLATARGKVSSGARIYICGEKDSMDASLIIQLPTSLELIAIAGSQTDRIDIEAARARGIKVSNIPEHCRSVSLGLKANIAAFLDRGLPLNRVSTG
ncbi:hypothetical protein GCM10011348_22220 [Marinobacterium nitratireducens]|uniref:D-isomer specific 2-hydroxyacid dehydrogenase catalytic domain-containing protein n=1 Tax=Marinobacterium nitratireducens TaxID=518897 RepID=A0A917ZHA8_9GAMM|nr:hypothetical protein [Marinobacterium nitratireducens]GGO81969.1 hypothetical protein GCM10011348_22220 [Marinobacterium nitratireducens]